MKTNRVLQVFTMMDRGGAESMIMNYYRNIDRKQIQFDFLVHRAVKCDFDDEIESLGGNIYILNPINPLFPNAYYQELRSFFKEHGHKYTIIHSHINTFSFFTLKIAREFSIDCRIVHAHIALDSIKMKDFYGGLESLKEVAKKLIKFRLRKRNLIHATHCFSCGYNAGKWLFGNDSKFTQINNAVDTQKFVIDPKVVVDYKKKFEINDEFVIGHVGRFDLQKNHSFLIKVFAAVVKKHPNSRLILVGEGPLRSRIESEAKQLAVYDKVDFLGVRSDVPELLSIFDSFVFPSFYEGLPVTLIEAQAAGIKILASQTITKEVSLTEDIKFLSINDSEELWANELLKTLGLNKKDNKAKIIDGGYDIISNTRMLQEFYIKQMEDLG